MKNEPVITAAAVSSLVGALLIMLVSLNVLQLTPEQHEAIMNFVVPLVAVLFPLGGAAIARQQVTPNHKIEVQQDNSFRLDQRMER